MPRSTKPTARSARALTKRRVAEVRSVRHKRRAALRARIRAKRPAHKRFILHPVTLLTILLAGVLIIGWTFLAAADSYGITAKVAAPALTDGALITEPSAGAVFTAIPITVSGSCPDNSYVKLLRNGAFSGVAWCTTRTFSIATSLSAGSNVVQAQDYNITDDPGPVTTGLTVIYNPPAPPAEPAGTAPQAPPAPLTLSSSYSYQAFLTGAGASWTMAITGGKTPYSIHTDWGDGQHTDQPQPRAGDLTLSHLYTQPGYFVIKVTITDAAGATTLLQLAALVHLPGTPVIGSGSTSSSSVAGSGLGALFTEFIKTSAWLWVAWPAYLVLVLMAISFWLGEQQELRELMTRHSRRPPRNRPLGHGA